MASPQDSHTSQRTGTGPHFPPARRYGLSQRGLFAPPPPATLDWTGTRGGPRDHWSTVDCGGEDDGEDSDEGEKDGERGSGGSDRTLDNDPSASTSPTASSSRYAFRPRAARSHSPPPPLPTEPPMKKSRPSPAAPKPLPQGRFSDAEVAALLSAVGKHGRQWRLVIVELEEAGFEKRSLDSVKIKFDSLDPECERRERADGTTETTYTLPTRTLQPWTAEIDARLLSLSVSSSCKRPRAAGSTTSARIDWKELAKRFPGRSVYQLRTRLKDLKRKGMKAVEEEEEEEEGPVGQRVVDEAGENEAEEESSPKEGASDQSPEAIEALIEAALASPSSGSPTFSPSSPLPTSPSAFAFAPPRAGPLLSAQRPQPQPQQRLPPSRLTLTFRGNAIARSAAVVKPPQPTPDANAPPCPVQVAQRFPYSLPDAAAFPPAGAGRLPPFLPQDSELPTAGRAPHRREENGSEAIEREKEDGGVGECPAAERPSGVW
ncbi:hypothetical protein JCM6882_008885 [Rhodosporidiobolus microsporus]